jgi:hypothetical protein
MAALTVTLLKDDGETYTGEVYRVVGRILKAERRLLSLLTPEEWRAVSEGGCRAAEAGRKKRKPTAPGF